ncbi:MAG: hypothetical protein WB554_18015 [Desulfomonilaceae bacterium]
MRRGFIFFVSILALALVPAMACAQYSGAFGLSGLPSMPSLFGGSGNCGGGAKCPAFVPELYVGWGIPQNRNTSVSLTAQGLGVAGITNVNLNLPTSGLWLGAALPVALSDNLSFVADGWYLVPGYSNLSSDEFYSYAGGGIAPIIIYNQLGNNWGAKPYWWYVDGAFAYTFAGRGCGGMSGGGFSLLLGVRYDYYTVGITSPDNIFNLFDNGDAGDVTSRAVIPFVGFQTSYRDSVQNLSVRIIGIPTIVGSSFVGLTTTGGNRFEYNDVTYNKGGQFYEIFGEYTRKFFGASQAGIFARWNTALAKSSGTGAIVNNSALQDSFDFSLYRTTWTLGGLVTLDFNTPFCN